MTIPKQLLEAKICNKDTCEEIRTLKKEIKVLLKENEAKEKVIIKYENMRKEAIELIENVDVSITEYLHGFGYENRKKDLLNILNKVGGRDE